MSEKLKPCPFCGGEATENRDISNSIYCKKCFAEIDTDCVDWNIRPIEDALQARIVELEAVIEILEDQQREAKNILIDKKLHIDSLYEEGYKMQQRIDKLEEAYIKAEDTLDDVLLGRAIEIGKLKKCIAELKAKQRWRVVADGELPNKNDYYWARDDLGQQGRILFYDGEWNKFTNLSYITHWMPMPTFPEVQE